MKNRRAFLHLSSIGLLSPFISTVRLPDLKDTESEKGVVHQPEDGETFFVRENTPITIQVSKKTDSIGTISVCSEDIQPGSRIPIHKHLKEDEYFIFHRGSGIIEIDGEEFPIKPGTSGLVPRGTWHSITNNSSDILTFTFGYSPAGFEDFFRQIGTPKGLPFKPRTAQEIMMIAEKYGMVYK